MRDSDEEQPPAEDGQSFDERVFSLHPMYQVLSFLQGLNVVFFLWALSTSLVFQENILSYGCLAIILLEAVNAVVKVRLLRRNYFLLTYLCESKYKELLVPLCVVAGCILMLLMEMVGSELAILVNLLIVTVLVVVGSNAFQYF
jgi:hypothetical protein